MNCVEHIGLSIAYSGRGFKFSLPQCRGSGPEANVTTCEKENKRLRIRVDNSRLPRYTVCHNLTVAAMLSAVAFILMFIEFPIPMLIPAFIKMDFSDLPALLGAFALGPVYGVIISFMKNLLHIVIKGTSTACVGELSNFILGAIFSAVAGYLYKHHKSRKTAIIGAVAGAVAMGVLSVPSNYFVVYPAYVQFYHMPLEAILGMYQAILPSADSLIKCLILFNLPFTLVKGLLDAVLCMLIYKPLSPILHGRR